VSQLLNQIDGAGPPPLTKEKIQEIPTALICQEHLGKNTYAIMQYYCY